MATGAASAAAAAAIAQHAATGTTTSKLDLSGGRFDFDDGGTYCGGWEDGKAHGHGVCTGPKGQGEYAGSWHYGFEVSGVYTWPSGSTYEGHWQNGKRHGLGVEARGRWLYRGEWTQGFKGRYGVRQSTVSGAKYEGTWANGLQDGYGSETYADGGTYQGQWLRGMRHGYGVRTSAPFGMASQFRGNVENMRGSETSLNQQGVMSTAGGNSIGVSPAGVAGGDSNGATMTSPSGAASASGSLASASRRATDEGRGGFVLRTKSEEVPHRRRSLGLKLKKQRSTGDLDRKGVTAGIRSTGSSNSWMSSESGYGATGGGGASIMSEGSNQSFMMEDEHLDPNVTETYMGEWKNDKRSGFGVSERSDGLKYEGEWYNNRKYGYGVTTFRDGTKEEGKYKNNVLVTSNQKRHLFLIRSAKFRERMDSALSAANRASKIALQKADIAISRTATARGKSEQSDIAAIHAREDGQHALVCAKQYSTAGPQPNAEHEAAAAAAAAASEATTVTDAAAQQQQQAARAPPAKTGPAVPSTTPSSQHQKLPSNNISAVPQQTHTSAAFSVQQNKPSVSAKPTTSTMPTFFQDSSSPAAASQQPQHQPTFPKPSTASAPVVGNFVPTNPANVAAPPAPMHNKVTSNYAPPQQQQPLRPQQTNPAYGARERQQQIQGASRNAINCDILPTSSPAEIKQQHPPIQQQQQRQQHFQQQQQSRPSPSAQQQSIHQEVSKRAPKLHQLGGGPGGEGGYNFQRIMDDHFEHYRRPPSRPASREQSVDRMPGSLMEAARVSRPSSRARNPLTRSPAAVTSADDFAVSSANANHSSNSREPSSSGLRYRGGGGGAGPPSQEIPNLGTVPKRTESLYMKIPEATAAAGPMDVGNQLQRKKSLPDVQNLVGVTSSQGSKEMTREEISVLSSSRRDNVRRQMEEIERYKSNPLMYIINPRVQEWISRQQLMLLVLFVNLSLAFMFFKLLT